MVVIFDCNIWVTLTLNRQIDYISDVSDSGITIASCKELKDEITTVLLRPKFNKLISESSVAAVIKLHDLITTTYDTGEIIKITSDPKDDYLFALASESKANYLVTGDKLLLGVTKYQSTELISFAKFKSIVT